MRSDVYMPATNAWHQYGILHGSGIVGTVQDDGRLMIATRATLSAQHRWSRSPIASTEPPVEHVHRFRG